MDNSRREFLKDLGMVAGGGLLLSTFPWLKSCTSAAKKEIAGEKARLAIVGTGSRGQYHINNLLNTPSADIVALCDNYAPHLEQAAALCPGAKKYSDYRQMLESSEIDGIVIATPLYMHAPIAIDAMKAGKDVFSEKAMAHTLEQCKAMYDTWKETGRVLYVGQQRLYDEKYIKALSMIERGDIGKIVGLRNCWFRNNDWRRPVLEPSMERHINWRLYRDYSCGLMTELGCHHLQNGTWALKSLPDKIMGSGDIVFWKDGREVYDTVSVIYHYPGGVQMTFESVISNKHFGMEEYILGHDGTINLSKGRIYQETPAPASGILQMINKAEHGMFDNLAIAGSSWVPENASSDKGELILPTVTAHEGSSTVGVAGDGSEEIVAAFCHSVITGTQAENLVEEAYYATALALLGLQAMEQNRVLSFPDEFRIPYKNLIG